MIDEETLENWKEYEREEMRRYEKINRFLFFLSTNSKFTLNLINYLSKHKKVVENLLK